MQTVLVVDDDESVRDLIEVILNVEGFTVHTAGSGAEALAVARSTPIDLVTIDLGLPDMNGLELSRLLREEPASARCRQMIVSGEPAPSQPDYVDAVLSKPFDFTKFTAVLRDLFQQPLTGAPVDPAESELRRILDGRLVRPLFQPIVDLETRQVVGVEGLARGPVDSPLHLPGPLFVAAHKAGRPHVLVSLCRFSAIAAARDNASLAPPLVFVNVEPGTVELPMTDELRALLMSDLPFQVVVEFTERALTRRLPALMRHAEEIRGRGNIVALDDMGLDPRAVAMLPMLQPEIVKLDMSLLHQQLTETAATTAVAVSAYAERTGACVIAEGIETEEQLSTALALGAHWGQGWLFGRPGPMEKLREMNVSRMRPPAPKRGRAIVTDLSTPFGLAAASKTPRRGTARLLDGISKQLEAQARSLGDLAVMLVALQTSRHHQAMLRRGYESLAKQAAVLGILGVGVPHEPMAGAYGVDLRPDDPLALEWVIVALGPHEASLLCAYDLQEGGPTLDRHFDFVLSHDRELAERVARLLMRRFTPREAIPRTTALPAQRAEGPA